MACNALEPCQLKWSVFCQYYTHLSHSVLPTRLKNNFQNTHKIDIKHGSKTCQPPDPTLICCPGFQQSPGWHQGLRQGLFCLPPRWNQSINQSHPRCPRLWKLLGIESPSSDGGEKYRLLRHSLHWQVQGGLLLQRNYVCSRNPRVSFREYNTDRWERERGNWIRLQDPRWQRQGPLDLFGDCVDVIVVIVLLSHLFQSHCT